MVTTTVQIRSSEYFSDDSIGKVDFQIKDPYTSDNYGLSDSTNDYGMYFGSFEHPANKAFEIELSTDYLNPFGKIQVNEGVHNEVDIRLIDLAKLNFELDCSGSGYIQNGQVIPTVYYSYDSPLYGYDEGLSKYFVADCMAPQQVVSAFSGKWIIKYDWKPTPSASWITLSDTITLAPGQDYTHTIVY